MEDSITQFFNAWEIADAETRLSTLSNCIDKSTVYLDPRTPDSLVGIDAINEYVGMFSANAPGWAAKVVKMDSIAGTKRVTIAFGGKGADGSEQVQLGQYFVEYDGALISRMTGFVGTGEP